MFKFELQQKVYYMTIGKIHAANILSRRYIDNHFKSSQDVTFKQFGNNTIQYSTIHGIYNEEDLFPSLQELGKRIFSLDIITEPHTANILSNNNYSNSIQHNVNL